MAYGFYVETPASERHDSTQQFHPENPERLECIREALNDAGIFQNGLVELGDNGRSASDEWRHEGVFKELEIVHDPRYLRKVARACMHASAHHEQYMDQDTYITKSTLDVIADSVSLVREATERALQHSVPAFCAVRPPGHHAGRQFLGGFCIANLTAYAAQLAHNAGAEKVAIVDWDAHHGNGTQSIFNGDPNVFYLSLHTRGIFPRGGNAADQGHGDGKGFTRNIALSPLTEDSEYLERFGEGISRIHDAMEPEAIVVSAGFDGHRDDPLGSLSLSSGVYGQLTDIIKSTWPEKPIISLLEGGYDYQALGESVVAHIRSLIAE